MKAGRIAALLGLAAGGLLLALYVFVGDRTWWGEAITVWPPLLWDVGLIASALVAWVLRDRRGAAAVIVLSVLFLLCTIEWRALLRRPAAEVIQRFETLRQAGGTGGATAVRIVSWNISRTPLLGELADLRPDLLLFQESVPPPASERARPAWAGFSWTGGEDPGLFSRWPLEVLPTSPVGPWSPPILALAAIPAGGRLLVADVRLVLPAVVLEVASPDGAPGLREGHRRRVEQFARLADLVDRAATAHGVRAIVLCGDFNTPGGAPSVAPLRRRLRDAWEVAGTGWEATMGSDLPVARIDQCWVSDAVEVVQARVLRARGSDHRALMVDAIVHP